MKNDPDIGILGEHSATADLIQRDLHNCPPDLLSEILGLVQEHIRKLKHNCGNPYNGIQKVRENIAQVASKVR
jgi:hypothetical protein